MYINDYRKYDNGIPLNELNVTSYNSTTFELSGTVSIGSYTGTSLIEALNAAADYHTLLDYSSTRTAMLWPSPSTTIGLPPSR